MLCATCGQPQGECLWDPDGFPAHDFEPLECEDCGGQDFRRVGEGVTAGALCSECGTFIDAPEAQSATYSLAFPSADVDGGWLMAGAALSLAAAAIGVRS